MILEGLSSEEAAKRHETFGPNAVVGEAGPPAWRIFARQFASIVVALLAAAAAVAFLTHDRVEGLAIVAVLLINAVVGFVTEWRSQRALESLRSHVRTSARVLRDGVQTIVDAVDLVPGDVVFLDSGARVPADAEIAEAHGLSIEEAALTGESVPTAKAAGTMAYLGTTVTSGRGTAVVRAIGAQTEIGRIGKLIRDVAIEPTPLEQRLAALGRRLVWIVLVIGAAVVVAGILRGDPLWQMVEVGISLAVAAVPEGLPAVTTLILAIGVLRMARRHAIVRKLPAVETLGSTTVICTDKTGTLTLNRLTLCEIDAPDPNDLLRIGALCSDAVVTPNGEAVGDPTEVALVRAAEAAGIDVVALRRDMPKIAEEPFDPATRRMVTTHGPLSLMKGAPEAVLDACGITGEERERLLKRNEDLAGRGLRVLAFAQHAAPGTRHFVFAGFAALVDPPRPGAAEAIQEAHAAGVRVVMLTGDQAATANAIARELGIDEAFARVTPAGKLHIVEQLRDAGEIVAVTGDGVNDAPALRRADIGIAMGKGGTDVAKETADLVLTDDNLGTIVSAIEEGRTIFANITKFVHLMFSHNLGEVIVVFTAIAGGLALPLLPLQILWMNVVTDIFPAFAIALEPPLRDRMLRAPRKSAALLSKPFLLMVAWQGAMLAAIALGAYAWALDRYGSGAHARTMALMALVAVQMGHTFNCRSRVASAFRGLVDNWHLWAATATVVVLQIVAVTFPPLRTLLGTTPLTRDDGLVMLACGVLPIVIVEIQKAIARRSVSWPSNGSSSRSTSPPSRSAPSPSPESSLPRRERASAS